MSSLCRPLGRTLVTPSCTFKLYGGPLPDPAVRALRGLALTWIGDVTAGFVRLEGSDRAIFVVAAAVQVAAVGAYLSGSRAHGFRAGIAEPRPEA